METRPAVLVVDDERLVLDLLRESLASHFDVTTASSGAEALRLLDEHEFAVLLADQRMPGMTGVSLAARARELSPHIVSVLLSAYADPKDFVAAINHGQVFRFISKPWELNDLVLTMQQAAERYRLSRDNAQLLEELERRLRALEILQAVVGAAAAGAAQHPAGILLDRLLEVVSFDLAAVLLAADNGEVTLQLKSGRPVCDRSLLELRDRAVSLYELAVGERLEESRIRPLAACEIAPVEPSQVESQVQVPLTVAGRAVGMLVLQSFAPSAFPPDVARLLDILANGAAETLQRMRYAAGREWRRLAQAMAALEEGVVVADGAGQVRLANRAAQDLLVASGLEVDDLWDKIGAELGVRVADRRWTRELQLGTRSLHVGAALLEGSEGDVVLTLRDVTSDKAREARWLRYIGAVSHEVRTPLSSIVATFDVLLQGFAGQLTKKQIEYLTAAASACEVLNSVVDDLIDMEKYAAGGLVLAKRSLHLGAVARDAAARFRAAAEENGLAIEVTGAADEIPLEADPVRLAQLLGNLLSNAIKYAPAGSQVRVEVGAAEKPSPWAVIGVHNAGEPLSPADLETIFDRFAVVGPSSPSSHRSSGLGLAICRSIAEAHGGVIAAESGRAGTSLWVALPRALGTRRAGRVQLAAPLWVQADDDLLRVALLGCFVQAGLPARLLPRDVQQARAARAVVGAGLVVAPAGCRALDDFVGLELGADLGAEAHTLVDALVALARHGTPQLVVPELPPSPVREALAMLGILVLVQPAGEGSFALPLGRPLEVLAALGAELSGKRGFGPALGLLRRARQMPGMDVVGAITLVEWTGFVAAYGPARARQLRQALYEELERLLGRETSDAAMAVAVETGCLVAGRRAWVITVARELPTRFDALVRLYCRREDREAGYIALGTRRVPLPALVARELPIAAADEEVFRALGLSP